MKHPILPVTIIIALVIFLAEALTGAITLLCDPMRSNAHYGHFVDEENWIVVRVCDMPQHRAKSIRVVGEVQEINDTAGNTHPCEGKIQLYLQNNEVSQAVRYGDIILAHVSAELPSGVENPHQFDYRTFLRRRGICYTDYLTGSHFRIVGHKAGGAMDRITNIRKQLIEVIGNSNLTISQQGIAKALCLGYDEDLQEETEDHFRRAGITHLLCVSGLHVGIVALLVGWCLSFMGNKRRSRILRGLVQMAVIWLFVLLTGMAPSALRAGLMFSFIVVGQMFFSRPPTLNVIASSALVLLIIKPVLLFEVGFQLSYAAVSGIVLFTRPLEQLLPLPSPTKRLAQGGVWLLRKLWSLMCVSLVAQTCTAPLILYYFHQFPLYFLIANMVVIPFASLLLGGVLVMLLVGWWPAAFNAVGWIVGKELAATEWITSTIASWPHSMLEHIYFDSAMLIMAYCIIALLGILLLHKRLWTLCGSLAIAIVFVAYTQRVEARCATQLHYDIYNVGPRHAAAEFFVGHNSYLVADSSIANHPEKIDYQTSNNLIWRQARRKKIIATDSSYCDDYLMVEKRLVSFNDTVITIYSGNEWQ